MSTILFKHLLVSILYHGICIGYCAFSRMFMLVRVDTVWEIVCWSFIYWSKWGTKSRRMRREIPIWMQRKDDQKKEEREENGEHLEKEENNKK